MGSANAKIYHDELDTDLYIDLEQVINIYNYRIKIYNPLIHGSKDNYMLQVEYDYEYDYESKYITKFLRSVSPF
jgi:hypothetical protein